MVDIAKKDLIDLKRVTDVKSWFVVIDRMLKLELGYI